MRCADCYQCGADMPNSWRKRRHFAQASRRKKALQFLPFFEPLADEIEQEFWRDSATEAPADLACFSPVGKLSSCEMSDITRMLRSIADGSETPQDLLPVVYEALRRMAREKIAREKPGQTLQATALAHEAYLRLVDQHRLQGFDSRGHFYSAAAEAMRRILVERARQKAGPKRGGRLRRHDIDQLSVACEERSDKLLALDEALEELEQHEP